MKSDADTSRNCNFLTDHNLCISCCYDDKIFCTSTCFVGLGCLIRRRTTECSVKLITLIFGVNRLCYLECN